MKFLFSEYELNLETLELRRDGELVPLPRLPLRLLCHLIEHRHRLVSKEELLRDVWNDTAVGEAALTTAIREVRRALDRGAVSIIENRRGIGYRIRVPIRAVGNDENASEDARREAVADRLPRRSSASDEVARRPPDASDLLLGRFKEQQLVRASLARVRQGGGAVVLFEGEAGIGKTSLLEWCADEAGTAGVMPILVRCREDAGAPALLPFLHLLERLGRSRPDLLAAMRERGEHVLGHVFPEIVPAPAERPGIISRDPGTFLFQGYEALTQLLREAAAGRPLALLLDDVHQADVSSKGLLEFVAARLADAPVLIVATLRPEPDPTPSIIRLARDRRSVTRSLSSLDRTDVERMLLAYRGEVSSELADLLWRQTGGNPFFLHQVLPALDLARARPHTSLADVLPQTVRKAVEQTCAAMSERARHALRVASAFGTEFSAESLAHLVEWPIDAVFEVLDEAVLARVVAPDADDSHCFRYVHLLVRDVLYRELGTDGRSRAHATIGDLLEKSGARSESRSAEIAHHFAAAATPPAIEKAIAYYSRAAELDAARLAYDTAIVHYRRALDLIDARPDRDESWRCVLLVELARTTGFAGDEPTARALWSEAAAYADLIGDHRTAIAVALDMSAAFDGSPQLLDLPSVTSQLERALRVCDPQDELTRARLLSRLALCYAHSERHDEAERSAHEGLELARSGRDPGATAEALMPFHVARRGTPHAEERERLAAQIRDLAVEAGDLRLALIYRAYRMSDLMELGRFVELDHEMELWGRASAAVDNPIGNECISRLRASRALMLGDIEAARRFNQSAIENAKRCHDRLASQRTRALIGQTLQIACEEGTHFESLWERVAPSGDSVDWAIASTMAYQELALPDRTSERVEYAMRHGFPRRRSWDWLYNAAALAQAIAYVGAREYAAEVRRWFEGFERLHVVQGAGLLYLGPASRYVGLLERTLGHEDRAVDWLERAIAECEATGVVTFRARAHVDLAETHATARGAQSRSVREHALRAHEIASTVGMTLVELRARRLLET